MSRLNSRIDRGSGVPCLALCTLPSTCFIRMEDVLEISAASSEDTDTIPLEELGLKSVGGLGTRLLRFRKAPDGPTLLFSAGLTSETLAPESLFPLHPALFSMTPYSNLVVIRDQVAGLLLSITGFLSLRPAEDLR